MDYNIVVKKFKLQSHYYIHFQINTLGKGMSLLILPSTHPSWCPATWSGKNSCKYKPPCQCTQDEILCFNQRGNISTRSTSSLKLIDRFTYQESRVSLTEKDINTWLTKAWTAIDRLSAIWKSDLTNKMKHSFFQAAVISLLLYGCTTWTLTKRMEKKLNDNYSRMLRAIFIKSSTKQQLYGHLPPIMKTIQVRWTTHVGHCWRSKDELISDILLWTPSHGQAKVGQPARTYIQQLCADMGCSLEDLLEAMNNREGW